MTKMRRNVVAVSFFPSPKGLEFDGIRVVKIKANEKKKRGGEYTHCSEKEKERERERERERKKKRETQ